MFPMCSIIKNFVMLCMGNLKGKTADYLIHVSAVHKDVVQWAPMGQNQGCQSVLASPPAWLESRVHFGIAIPAAQADPNRNRDTLSQKWSK